MSGVCVICDRKSDDNEIVEYDGGMCRVCARCRENLKYGKAYAEQVAENERDVAKVIKEAKCENNGTN
jgi:hypothetical protein